MFWNLTPPATSGANPANWFVESSTVSLQYLHSGRAIPLFLSFYYLVEVRRLHCHCQQLLLTLKTVWAVIDLSSDIAVRAKLQRQAVMMLAGFLVSLVVLLAIHYYSRAKKYLQLPSPGPPLPVVTFIHFTLKYTSFRRLVMSTNLWQRNGRKTQ